MKDREKGYKGDCCCNCQYQTTLFKHPWNKGKLKGSMKEVSGLYSCNVIFLMGNKHGGAVLFDRKHGMCEMYIGATK